MIATLSLFLWLIGLYVILKYRVHIHVNITTKTNAGDRKKGRPGFAGHPGAAAQTGEDGKPKVQAIGGVPEDLRGHQGEIIEALVSLGCPKAKARQVAEKVCSQPGSFDELLRAAIREAA
jgi:RuvA, C-terminal domain